MAKSKLEVLEVQNDLYNYYLTCKTWAENLDAARDEIVSRWGEMLYRRFRLYLWGSAQRFLVEAWMRTGSFWSNLTTMPA